MKTFLKLLVSLPLTFILSFNLFAATDFAASEVALQNYLKDITMTQAEERTIESFFKSLNKFYIQYVSNPAKFSASSSTIKAIWDLLNVGDLLELSNGKEIRLQLKRMYYLLNEKLIRVEHTRIESREDISKFLKLAFKYAMVHPEFLNPFSKMILFSNLMSVEAPYYSYVKEVLEAQRYLERHVLHGVAFNQWPSRWSYDTYEADRIHSIRDEELFDIYKEKQEFVSQYKKHRDIKISTDKRELLRFIFIKIIGVDPSFTIKQCTDNELVTDINAIEGFIYTSWFRIIGHSGWWRNSIAYTGLFESEQDLIKEIAQYKTYTGITYIGKYEGETEYTKKIETKKEYIQWHQEYRKEAELGQKLKKVAVYPRVYRLTPEEREQLSSLCSKLMIQDPNN